MNDVRDIINFTNDSYYKDVSLSNFKMHLIGYWRLQIILIVTSICIKVLK